jgi:hypothetical protein
LGTSTTHESRSEEERNMAGALGIEPRTAFEVRTGAIRLDVREDDLPIRDSDPVPQGRSEPFYFNRRAARWWVALSGWQLAYGEGDSSRPDHHVRCIGVNLRAELEDVSPSWTDPAWRPPATDPSQRPLVVKASMMLADKGWDDPYQAWCSFLLFVELEPEPTKPGVTMRLLAKLRRFRLRAFDRSDQLDARTVENPDALAATGGRGAQGGPMSVSAHAGAPPGYVPPADEGRPRH